MDVPEPPGPIESMTTLRIPQNTQFRLEFWNYLQSYAIANASNYKVLFNAASSNPEFATFLASDEARGAIYEFNGMPYMPPASEVGLLHATDPIKRWSVWLLRLSGNTTILRIIHMHAIFAKSLLTLADKNPAAKESREKFFTFLLTTLSNFHVKKTQGLERTLDYIVHDKRRHIKYDPLVRRVFMVDTKEFETILDDAVEDAFTTLTGSTVINPVILARKMPFDLIVVPREIFTVLDELNQKIPDLFPRERPPESSFNNSMHMISIDGTITAEIETADPYIPKGGPYLFFEAAPMPVIRLKAGMRLASVVLDKDISIQRLIGSSIVTMEISNCIILVESWWNMFQMHLPNLQDLSVTKSVTEHWPKDSLTPLWGELAERSVYLSHSLRYARLKDVKLRNQPEPPEPEIWIKIEDITVIKKHPRTVYLKHLELHDVELGILFGSQLRSIQALGVSIALTTVILNNVIINNRFFVTWIIEMVGKQLTTLRIDPANRLPFNDWDSDTFMLPFWKNLRNVRRLSLENFGLTRLPAQMVNTSANVPLDEPILWAFQDNAIKPAGLNQTVLRYLTSRRNSVTLDLRGNPVYTFDDRGNPISELAPYDVLINIRWGL